METSTFDPACEPARDTCSGTRSGSGGGGGHNTLEDYSLGEGGHYTQESTLHEDDPDTTQDETVDEGSGFGAGGSSFLGGGTCEYEWAYPDPIHCVDTNGSAG